MKRMTLLLFLLASISIFAQTETVTKEDLVKELQPLKTSIQTLQNENNKLKIEVGSLKTKISDANKTIVSLQKQTQTNSTAISQTANELGVKISATETNANQKISEIGNSLSTKTRYGIIGVLIAILISGLLYWLLSKRQQADKNLLSNIINSTKTELNQESAKLDGQLLYVIEKQLKVVDKLNAIEPRIDHTFHKNSANELQRISNYANSLDPKSQEAVALQGSLGRLRNYFNSSDYEITDFTGKDYDERIPMKIKDTFFEETLKKGSEIITRTLKPQIKYKGEVIQEAEVSTKYNN